MSSVLDEYAKVLSLARERFEARPEYLRTEPAAVWFSDYADDEGEAEFVFEEDEAP